MSERDEPPFRVHVIGGGFGESVVVEFPDGAVGVVDCFSAVLPDPRSPTYRSEQLAANPTLRFLVEHVKAEQLAFIAMTHPHEDHVRGMSHLLDHYRDEIDRIWIFHGFNEASFRQYLRCCLRSSAPLPIEEIIHGGRPDLKARWSSTKEMYRTLDAVVRQLSSDAGHRAEPAHLIGPRTLRLPEQNAHVRVLGPVDRTGWVYVEELKKSTRDVVEPEAGELLPADRFDPRTIPHNMASPALLIECGAARILLCGDMEREAWEAALAAREGADPSLACSFVKVGHHGSKNGLCDGLYNEVAGGAVRAKAVLTPYNRNAHPLQSAEGLGHLKAFDVEIHATNLEATLAGLRRGGTIVDEAAVLELARNVKRRALLRAAIEPGRTESVDEETLLQALGGRPLEEGLAAATDFGGAKAGPPERVEHDCRVSVAIDVRTGKCEVVHVGSHAGEIPFEAIKLPTK